MSNNLTAFFDLLLALFASIGVIYCIRDIWTFLTRKSVKTRAVLTITLSDNKTEAVKELLEIANFYHLSSAQRYIEKIVVKNPPREIAEEREHLEKSLRLPLDFKNV